MTRRLEHSTLLTRNVRIGGFRTSVRLEPELWDALDEICAWERLSIDEICVRAEKSGVPGGRTSRLRVFIVGYFRAVATSLAEGSAERGTPLPADTARLAAMAIAWRGGNGERRSAAKDGATGVRGPLATSAGSRP